MYVSIHSSKFIECTPPILNSDAECGLCVIMTCQCNFIDRSKWPSLLRDFDDEGGCMCEGEGGLMKDLCSFLLILL